MKRPRPFAKNLLFVMFPVLAITGGFYFWPMANTIAVEAEGPIHLTPFSFSPDGKRLATYFLYEPTRTYRGVVFDLESGQKICDLKTPPPLSPSGKPYRKSEGDYNPVYPMWSPDGKRIVAGYSDGLTGDVKIPLLSSSGKAPQFRANNIAKIAVWDADSGDIKGNHYYASIAEDSESSFVGYSKDGKKLLGGGTPKSYFDANTGQRLGAFKGEVPLPSQSEVIAPKSLISEVSSDSKRVEIRDLSKKRTLLKLESPHILQTGWRNNIFGIIYLTGDHFSLKLWDSKSEKFLPSPPSQANDLPSHFKFNPSKPNLVYRNRQIQDSQTSTEITRLIVWDYQKHRQLWRFSSAEKVNATAWSPDGNWLGVMTADDNGPLNVLLFDQNGILKHQRKISDYAWGWSPDSKSMAVAAQHGDKKQIEIIRVSD